MRVNARGSVAVLTVLVVCGVVAATLAGQGPAVAASKAKPYHFRGRATADLAVWVPLEDIRKKTSAGAVNVLYSQKKGLKSKANQFWNQNSPGVTDSAGIDHRFGSALASGDFNRDGYADLAIGVPGQSVATESNAGAVEVLYGTANGLKTSPLEQYWDEASPGIGGAPRAGDSFGAVVSSGDYDGDGFDDLAIAAPNKDVGSKTEAGQVYVLYGGGGGLSSAGSDTWTQTSAGTGKSKGGNRFGSSLTSGHFDKDGRADLAIGAPGEKVKKFNGAGAVCVLYGSGGGLSPSGSQHWTQGGKKLRGDPGKGKHFGAVLAAGHFQKSGYDDLAVGVPGERSGGGGVQVIQSTGHGLHAAGDQIWTQATFGIPGKPSSGHCFGCALATGNFGFSSLDDLAIGAKGQRIGKGGGAVVVLFGQKKGLSVSIIQYWGMRVRGVPGKGTSADNFGASLMAANFGRGGYDDLAVGDPNAKVGKSAQAGSSTVLYGKKEGLSRHKIQLWTQNSKHVKDKAEPFDEFSLDLTAG
jgi:FG-GAP repeat